MLFRVRDTITIERVWVIEAKDEDDARGKADSGLLPPEHEEQIDNTPYEITPIKTDYPRR